MVKIVASTTTRHILLYRTTTGNITPAPRPNPLSVANSTPLGFFDRRSLVTSSPTSPRINNSKMGAPVILCGKTEKIGTGVIEMLKPEYDVIHFILTPQAGVSQIPAILRGDKSTPSDSQLGSKDYSTPPVAVLLGGGYDDADIDLMFKAARDAVGASIPWLRPDLSKPAPPLGPDYGKALVERIKALLAQMEKEGKMKEGKVVWY